MFSDWGIELIVVFLLVMGGASAAIKWLGRYHDIWANFLNALPFYLINIYAKYTVFAFLLSIVLIFILVIYIFREQEIKAKIMSRALPLDGKKETEDVDSAMENSKWKLVMEHIDSEDANKWKLAVLEADIILSELLDSLHLSGESIGEKLKAVESSDFDHIEEAWEAHKIRNAIAHQGSDFLLTKREAQRVVGLYESVFKEFEII